MAVVTFRRPAELSRLLTSLRSVKFAGDMRVIVVDNDPEGSAGEVAAKGALESPVPLAYVVEPTPGISAARNRAIRECSDARFISFIDDDETPTPTWLQHLVDVQRRFSADLVAGPVLPVVEGGPHWLVEGGFFDRPRRSTAPGWFFAGSGNLLVRLGAQERLGGPFFDVRLGLTGGEDSLLSLKARRVGLRMAWADDAEVTEFVPSYRARVNWVLCRAYRCGTTIALCETMIAEDRSARLAARISRALKGVAHTCIGVARTVPLAITSGRVGALRALRELAMGLGMLAGAMGRRYVEYRRLPSRRRLQGTGVDLPLCSDDDPAGVAPPAEMRERTTRRSPPARGAAGSGPGESTKGVLVVSSFTSGPAWKLASQV